MQLGMVDRSLSVSQVATLLGMSSSSVRLLTNAGILSSERTSGGHRRFVRAQVFSEWKSYRGGVAVAPDPSPEPSIGHGPGGPTWERTLGLEGLEQDSVWSELLQFLVLDEHPLARDALAFAFSSVLGNAIEHSLGETVRVTAWAGAEARIVIADDGAGVFERLRMGLRLADRYAAIQELSKGKRTTAPHKHTGQGIFFASKVVDMFALRANSLGWIVDNLRHDTAVSASPIDGGTEVELRLDRSTTRDLAAVFADFTTGGAFVKTRPSVKLFEIGTEFVSRNEAKRLASGLDDFETVELDFTGVASIGQAFVDELFRAWAQDHPATTLEPIHMNEAVRFMVERGLDDIPSRLF